MISAISLRYIGQKNSSDQSRLYDSEQYFSVSRGWSTTTVLIKIKMFVPSEIMFLSNVSRSRV